MPLSGLQRSVTEIALALPQARYFCLVGGAALIEHGVVERPTDDIDLFTTRVADVAKLAAALADAMVALGWHVVTEREFESFVRLRVTSSTESVRVDIAFDVRIRPPLGLAVGSVAHIEELAADKVLAIFARAEPRDLVDLDALGRRLDLPTLVALGREKDHGLVPAVLADAIRAAAAAADARFALLGLSPDDLALLRARAQAWAAELRSHPDGM